MWGWAPLGLGCSIPYPQNQNLSYFLSPHLACLQETWTGNEKITDGQEKEEEEEKEKEGEEEVEEMTKTERHSKHDPEDL